MNNTHHINKRGTSLKDGTKHSQDHELWTRRNFLSTVGIGGSLSLLFGKIPLLGMAASPLHAALANSETDRILVLVRLGGGNDGLNTVIPLYDYDTYQGYRPTLAIPETDVLGLDGGAFGLHPAMSSMSNMWNNGQAKIIHGVGYNNMALSHFEGADTWAKARILNTGDQSGTGFVGGILDSEFPEYLVNPPDIPPAIFIGTGSDLILSGRDTSMGLTINNIDQFYNLAQTGEVHNTDFATPCFREEQLQFSRSIANSAYAYSDAIYAAYQSSANNVEYLGQPIDYLGSFDRELAIIARLIKGNLGTKIYLVELNGFDTHGDQSTNHPQLLEHLSANMALFFEDLAGAGYEDKVIAMTISEFGRRIADTTYIGGTPANEAGTDHGEAAPMMLFGPALEGNGFLGEHPDIEDSMNNNFGNLEHSTDFRSVYATVLENWLCVEPTVVNQVLGGDFPRIDGLVPACGDVLLPTELVYFQKVFQNSKCVRFEWKTLTESNTDKFEVQKSNDAVNFSTIGEKPAADNSTQPLVYRHEYNNPNYGGYYRLKIVYNDGTLEYSNIIQINTESLFREIEVFPNPMTDNSPLNIKINTYQPMTVNAEIVNITGRIVGQKTFDLNTGNNQLRLSLEHLPKGEYSVRFTNNGGWHPAQKIIKLK